MLIRLEKIQNMKELNHFESIAMLVMSHKDKDFTYLDQKNQYFINTVKCLFTQKLQIKFYVTPRKRMNAERTLASEL